MGGAISMAETEGLEDMISKKEMQKLINDGKREVEKKYQEYLEELKDSDTYKIAEKLKKSGMKPSEIDNVLRGIKAGNPISGKSYNIGKHNAKFGIISDTHIGSKYYDPHLMTFAARQFTKEGVDFVVHVGDVVDGWYQNRPQSIFEQNAIGYDEQKAMAIDELGQIKQPLYFITGNHEYNTYVRNAGVELGKELEKGLRGLGNKATYLGNADGEVKLKNGTKIQLLHPDGGTAYAISYRPQKIVESMESGHKPNILLIGHYHKAEYLFYRNVHIFQAGTFENQTKFMQGRQIPAHKGFWIVDINSKNGGQVDNITPRFYPTYE
jgi:predicted phosphodiesterase